MAGSIYKRCGCTDVDEAGKRKQRGTNCPQLRRSNGSWNPRHGTWAYSLGITVGGARRQVSKAGFPSEAAASAALDKLRAEHGRGIRVTERSTVGEYLTAWLAGKTNLRPTTRRLYAGGIKHHCMPHLGHLRLDELRVRHVAAMLEAAHAKGLTHSTVSGVRRMLRAALNDAMREELIASNPAALAKLPTMEKAAKPMVWTAQRVTAWERTDEVPGPVMVWTPAHLGTFLDAIAKHRLYALYHLLAFRGLRRGEACGLEWNDFEWDAGTVTIARQIITLSGDRLETRPKSDAGSRVISLDAGTIEVLKRHRSRALRDRLSTPPAAGKLSAVDKVFTTKRGCVLDPNKVSREFRRLSSDAGLPPIRLHDLRHVAASLMLASGADMKVIQETLGHSTLLLTANTYTSLYPDVAHAAAEAAAAIVPRRAVD